MCVYSGFMSATWRQTFKFAATRVFPIGFAVGAGMEAFMCATGFYKVATRKEAERYIARQEQAAKQHPPPAAATPPLGEA